MDPVCVRELNVWNGAIWDLYNDVTPHCYADVY